MTLKEIFCLSEAGDLLVFFEECLLQLFELLVGSVVE